MPRGNAAAAADDQLISDIYAEFHSEFVELGIVNWGSTDDVPDDMASHVITVVAYKSCDEFSVPEPRVQRLAIQADQARRNLMALTRPTYQPTQTKHTDY